MQYLSASRLRALFLLLLVFLFSSCDQEWWFNADGSGRLRIIYDETDIKNGNETYEVAAQKWKDDCTKYGLVATTSRDYVGGSERWLFDVSFKSITQLSQVDKDGKSETHFWLITNLPQQNIRYQYYMEITNDAKDDAFGINAMNPKTLTLHLPGQIISSNAASTDFETNTVIWNTDERHITPVAVAHIAAVLTPTPTSPQSPDQTVSTPATADTPPPLLLYIGLPTLLILLVIGLFFWLRSRKTASALDLDFSPSPLTGQPYIVFLSHSSKDAKQAQQICGIIESAGIRCWIAPRDVRPGYEYAAEIVVAITSCPVMLVLLTKNANASRHVRAEVERAASADARLLGVRLANVPPDKGLDLFLGPSHWLDLHTAPAPERAAKLLAAITAITQKK